MPSEYTAVLGEHKSKAPIYGGRPQNTSRLIHFFFPAHLLEPTSGKVLSAHLSEQALGTVLLAHLSELGLEQV